MDNRFTFVVSSEIKAKIEERAAELGMSTSSYVRMIVLQDLKKEG